MMVQYCCGSGSTNKLYIYIEIYFYIYILFLYIYIEINGKKEELYKQTALDKAASSIE